MVGSGAVAKPAQAAHSEIYKQSVRNKAVNGAVPDCHR